MGKVAGAVARKFNGQASQRVVFTESHDEVANGRSRVPEEIWPGNAASWAARKRSTLGAAVMFTSPGIPMLFQGQEFLEDGHFSDSDALDWGKAHYHQGITNLYRDLVHLRRNWRDNTRGLRGDHVSVHHVNNGGKVIAYHRWDGGGPGDDVVVVANFSGQWYGDYRVGFPRGGRWYVRFNSDWNGYSGDFGNTATLDLDANGGGADGMGQSGGFQLGPYSAVIFSQ
jgi:1,4-alpha-glucan branching enzyme